MAFRYLLAQVVLPWRRGKGTKPWYGMVGMVGYGTYRMGKEAGGGEGESVSGHQKTFWMWGKNSQNPPSSSFAFSSPFFLLLFVVLSLFLPLPPSWSNDRGSLYQRLLEEQEERKVKEDDEDEDEHEDEEGEEKEGGPGGEARETLEARRRRGYPRGVRR
eukprot:9504176-Pyramimonas_sp.AAC.4